jgi:hypothetical protein
MKPSNTMIERHILSECTIQKDGGSWIIQLLPSCVKVVLSVHL